jgi:hypothetical protein
LLRGKSDGKRSSCSEEGNESGKLHDRVFSGSKGLFIETAWRGLPP